MQPGFASLAVLRFIGLRFCTEALGVQHSLYLNDFLANMTAELNHHPRTSAFVLVMPNTPVWGGAGRPSEAGWQPGVVEARDELMNAVKISPGVSRKRLVGLYNSASLASQKRPLRVDMVMVTSSATEPDGKPVSLFQLSPVWQREAFAALLEANPRSNFNSYADAMILFDRGHADFNVEYRQHNTGAAFWDAVVTAICSGPLGSSDFSCHVRDWCLFDPGMALAVSDIRGRKSQKIPTLGYAGTSFQDFMHSHGGAHIAHNVKEAILAHLKFNVASGAHVLPGFAPVAVPVGPGSLGAGAPPPPSNFKHCGCRDQELPLKQELYDQWGQSAVKDQWEELVKEHDGRVNKSGVPHKARRAPETAVAALLGGDAAVIPATEGKPATLDALKEARPTVVV